MKNKRVLVAVLLALPIGGCASTQDWEREMTRNNANIAKLEIGMEKARVHEIMGEPILREAYQGRDGSLLDVWFYYTNRQQADYMKTSGRNDAHLYAGQQAGGLGTGLLHHEHQDHPSSMSQLWRSLSIFASQPRGVEA